MSGLGLGCLIIGAGLSGLSAACYLQAHGLDDFLVLEGRARVGGRTSTISTADKHWIDVGGAYVGPGQHRILRLARELGVQTEPMYSSGRSVMMLRGQRTECEGSLPRLGPRGLVDVNAALTATETVSNKVNLSRPWDENKVEGGKSLDSMTTEEWLQSACETEDGREMYRALVRDLLCVEAADVSALFWMWYLHSGQGVDIITGVQGGAQEAHFTGGSQQISDKMWDKIGRQRVLTDKVVVSLDWHHALPGASAALEPRTPPLIVISCRDGSTYSAARVIIALSPALYPSIHFRPPLPSWKAQPMSRMHMGSIIKTITRYSSPWWRDLGYSGILCCLPAAPYWPSSSPPPPIGYSFDDCHAEPASDGSSFFALMGFCYAATSSYYLSLSAQQRQLAVTQQYRFAFQSELALSPLSYTECDWTAEELSKGCYSAVMPPRVMTEVGDGLRRAVGGMHWAGTELAVQWSGYMAGAVESGVRAAHEVLLALPHNTVKGEFSLDEQETGWTTNDSQDCSSL